VEPVVPDSDPEPQQWLTNKQLMDLFTMQTYLQEAVLRIRIHQFHMFLPSWIWIRIRNKNADPDPATQINADPCGSGSETLVSGTLLVFLLSVQQEHVCI
jgi:hypothetical protein